MSTVIPFRTIEISRAKVEAAIETLVEILDQIDAPTEDLEPEHDKCEAADDDLAHVFADHGAGASEDAEPDDQDRCEASDDDPARRFRDGGPGDVADAEYAFEGWAP